MCTGGDRRRRCAAASAARLRNGEPQAQERIADAPTQRRWGFLRQENGPGPMHPASPRHGALRLLRGRARAAFDRDLLDRPGRAVTFVDDVLRLAVQLVNQTAALAVPLAGLRPAKQVPGQIELV